MERKTDVVVEPSTTTFGQDLWGLLRHGLRGRRGLLIIGSALALVGVGFGWDWMVAVGIGPVLLGVLPCIVMCAFGLCMSRVGRKSCASDSSDDVKATKDNQQPRSSDEQ